MKWLSHLLVSTLLFLLTLFILVASPLGLHTALFLFKHLGPGHLSYQSSSGHLFKDIHLTQVKYRYHQNTITIGYIDFRWAPVELLAQRFHINHIRAENINITWHRQPQKSNAVPSSDEQKISFPFTLIFEEISLHHCTLKINNSQTIKIKNFYSSSKFSNALISSHSTLQLDTPFNFKSYLTLQGRLSDYHIFSTLQFKDSHLEFSGTGNDSSATISLRNSKLLNGEITGKITAQWFPSLKIISSLNGKNINNSSLTDITYPQQLNFQMDNQITRNVVNIKIQQFSVLLNQQPLQGQFDFNSNKTNLFTTSLLLTSKQNKITVEGGLIHNQWNLKWLINTSQLSNYTPLLTGAVVSTGTIKGNSQTPLIQGNASINNFTFKNIFLQKLNSTWKINCKENKYSTFKLEGNQIQTPLTSLQTLSLKAFGSLLKHRIKLAAVLFPPQTKIKDRINLQLQGSYQQKIWQGTLQQLTLKPNQTPSWTLKKPSNISLSAQKINYSLICLASSPKNKFCTEGNWQNQGQWHFYTMMQNVNLNILSTRLNNDLFLSGSASGEASLQGKENKSATGYASLTITNGKLHKTVRHQKISLPFSGNFLARLQSQKLNSQLKIKLSSSNSLTAEFQLPQFNFYQLTSQQPLSGSINIKINKLANFPVVFPGVGNIQGNMEGQLQFGGQLASPELVGNLKSNISKLELEASNINLKNIQLAIQAQHHTINYQMQLFSEGNLAVSGSSNTNWQSLQAEFTATGTNLLIANTPEYQIYVSPDLKAIINDNNLTVSGKIEIPKAQVELLDTSPDLITLPNEDIRFVHQTKAEAPSWNIKLDLNVIADNAVNFKGYGINGTLSGDVTLQQAPQQILTASGKLILQNGTYSAYGQNLTISKGYLEYANSPLANPNLDIQATKKITATTSFTPLPSEPLSTQTFTVGINVSGNFHHLQTSLFSTPISLSQTDILSYLLTGQPASAASTPNLGLLLQAANALQSSSSEKSNLSTVLDSAMNKLGITEFGVESQTTLNLAGSPIGQQSSFVIGKQLSKKLLFRYSKGLTYPIDIYQLQYLISNKWSAQFSVSSLGYGGDIFYTFNSNHKQQR